MNSFTVFLLCLASFTGSVTRAQSDDGEVLYEPLNQRTFAMPATCKSQNMEFCFSNTDYPTDIIVELLTDITNLEVANEKTEAWSTEQRMSSPEEDCVSKAINDPIYYIVDEEGNDRVVVQMEDRFEQRYSVVRCEKEGLLESRTPHFLELTVKANKMSCQNKYMNYDFLVLSKEPVNGVWKMERARTKTGIPVCCACRYEKK